MTYLERTSLSMETLIVSSSLRFDPNTVEMLLGENIRTIGALIALTEVQACQMLLEDCLGFGMSNELARDAVKRFMELRGQLDRLGYGFDCLHYLFISDLLGKAARQNVQYLEMVRAAIESDSADPVAWCTLHNLCLSVHEYDSPTMIEPYNYLTGHTGRGPMMAFTWKQMNCSGGASIRLCFYLEEKKAYCKVDKGSPILQPSLPPDFWREMGCE
jgi:hypothetical protein